MGHEGKYDLYIRAEFVNIFNRTLMAAPISGGTRINPALPPSKNNLGIYTGGFGVINAYLAPGTVYANPSQATNFVFAPCTGTLIGRFSF
jgi:hypothetical protein